MNNWINEAIFYHIYPLGFCGAPQYHQEDVSHSILKLKEWIPHLLDMHVNALYLGPVFESYEHGYDTSDYRLVDHRLGTNQDFKEVCDALHAAGIRIVLDGVFNHVGRYFHAFRDVQEHGSNSSYCNWFKNLHFHASNPCGDPFTYDTWEGHYNLVKLNLSNEDVVKHLLESVAYWMDEFHIDGLRLDAADCIDPVFFQRLKKFCKEKQSNFWLMGEIIHGDYTRWANSNMLDSVTNYECYKGLYSAHNEKNYFEIAHSLQRQFANGGIYQDLTLYNFVDNHDVNRLASVVKDQKDIYNIYTLMYTMPGIPSIYYGSEWSITGTKHHGSDADVRPCLALDEMMQKDQSLVQHLSALGNAKKALHCLQYGKYEQVILRNEQFVFTRKYENESIYTALNVSDEPYSVEWSIACNAMKDVLTNKVYPVKEHRFTFTMDAKKGYIFIPINEEVAMEDSVAPSSMHILKQSEVTAPTPNMVINEAEPQHHKEIPIGKYRHYKGQNYILLYIAAHSETEEEYVVYRESYGDGNVWVRPLSMFTEKVNVNGKSIPRFTYISK